MHTSRRCPVHFVSIQILRVTAMVLAFTETVGTQQEPIGPNEPLSKIIRQVPPVIIRKLDKNIRIAGDTWLLSISLPLQGHLDYVKQLKNTTLAFQAQAQAYFDFMESSYYGAIKTDNAYAEDAHLFTVSAGKGLKSRITQLVTEVTTIDKQYDDLASIYLSLNENDVDPYEPEQEIIQYTPPRGVVKTKPRRKKRSLPFLLGILTTGLSISNYARSSANSNRIRTLASNQHDIIANQRDLVLILNSSVEAIAKNREHVLKLSDHVNSLVTNLQGILNKISNELHNYVQLNSLTEVLTSTLGFLTHQCDSARVELQSLQSHLNLALRGHFPVNLISHDKLTRMLEEVSSDAVHEYKVEHTSSLYLSSAYVYSSKATIYVIVSLPLVKLSDPSYHLYEVVNHPYFEGTDVVKLDLETDKYLALETNGINFRILTVDQVSMCLYKSRSVCHLNTAEFSTNTAKTCLIGWYLRNTAMIRDHCHKETLFQRQIPHISATILTNTHAIIFTPEQRQFREICPPNIRAQTTKFFTIEKGNTMVPITPGCTITDPDIKITSPIRPVYTVTADNFVNLQIESLTNLGLANLSDFSFKTDPISLSTFSFSNPKAPEWIATKFNAIKERFLKMKDLDFSTHWKLYLTLSILAVLFIGGVIAYVHLKRKLKQGKGYHMHSIEDTIPPRTPIFKRRFKKLKRGSKRRAPTTEDREDGNIEMTTMPRTERPESRPSLTEQEPSAPVEKLPKTSDVVPSQPKTVEQSETPLNLKEIDATTGFTHQRDFQPMTPPTFLLRSGWYGEAANLLNNVT